MKNEKMLYAIGRIDDDMIEDAVIRPGKKKQPFVRTPAFRRVVAIAACFVLIVGLTFSMPNWLNPNNEDPGVPIEPGVPDGPGVVGPVNPDELLPPVMQDERIILINGMDKLSYYAAIRMIEAMPKATKQYMTGGSYSLSLLTNGIGKDEIPVPETTGPDETQGPTAAPERPAPPDDFEDIYYYELDPRETFYINKVSMFQIELTDENGFLASKLGLGVVDVVITEDFIWGDSLITFRNGEKFYSCLTNGWSRDEITGESQWEFSTHKYVDGFFVVKNGEQENYAFYIDMDAQGRAVAFHCREAQNGGERPDQNVKVVSSTVISNEGRSFTVAELESYFNSGITVPPEQPRDPADDEVAVPPEQPQDPSGVERPAYTYDVYYGGEYVFSMGSEGAFIFHHVSGQNVDYEKGTYTMLEGSLELTFLRGEGATETVSCELSQNGFIYKGTEYVKDSSVSQCVTADAGADLATGEIVTL